MYKDKADVDYLKVADVAVIGSQTIQIVLMRKVRQQLVILSEGYSYILFKVIN